MQATLQLIHPLTLDDPVHVGNATFVPLLLAEPFDGELPYTLLDQALAEGRTRVSEVHARGVVQRIHVSHHGRGFLLLLDGEQVVGAKQDRIFNASFVIAPGSETDVPVSCVEQGRWGVDDPGRGTTFGSSETTFVGSARGRKLRRVARNTSAGRAYDADQHGVWTDVEAYLTSTRVRSKTSAFKDAYAQAKRRVRTAERHLEPRPGQVGLAVVRDGRLVGLDLLVAPSLYRRVWKKLANGALAEVDPDGRASGDPREVIERVGRAWRNAKLEVRVAPGCGRTLHGISDDVAFGALEHQGKIVHLFASEA